MKRLLVIALFVSLVASCKISALQQEYVFQNGKAVKIGKPQPYQIKDGAKFYRVYRKNITKKII